MVDMETVFLMRGPVSIISVWMDFWVVEVAILRLRVFPLWAEEGHREFIDGKKLRIPMGRLPIGILYGTDPTLFFGCSCSFIESSELRSRGKNFTMVALAWGLCAPKSGKFCHELPGCKPKF